MLQHDRVEHSVQRRGRADHDADDSSDLQRLLPQAELVSAISTIKDDAKHEEVAIFIVDPERKDKDKGKGKAATAKTKKGDKNPQARVGGTVLFLNGLRGLAALIVIEQHGNYWPDVNLGACAVDVFFVLSAFLLTMLFERKCRQLLAQHASLGQWVIMLVDYLSKRFFRVYPLFAATALLLDSLSAADRARYFKLKKPGQYDLYDVLTFKFEARYHVFWTLPVEIGYYFLIPVFVAAMIALRKYWWVLAVSLYVWVIHEGVTKFRTSHFPLAPHIPTFLAGSLAAIVYAQADRFIKDRGFELSKWHRLALRTVEAFFLCLFLSVAFRGLFFHWVHANPVPAALGFPFVSVIVTVILVIEMLLPSALSRLLEWNFFMYAGKISFSMYLLHSFVIYNPTISHQTNKYDRFFLDFGVTMMLSTITYWLIEYPSQLVAQRVSRLLHRFVLTAPVQHL